jgi:serine/threonine protein kinase
MAPERFQGRCGARSDVYSLGLTLYELVALKPAYEAADRHTLMERVPHKEPARLKKLAPGVPRDLETIITKAIARDSAARYATAGPWRMTYGDSWRTGRSGRGGPRRRSAWYGGAGGTRG